MSAGGRTGAVTTIGVALKWVDLRPEVDPLSGAVVDDAHSYGCSAADQAALEWALRLAEQVASGDPSGAEVVVVTVGPAGADALGRDALAAGATRAVRVDGSPDAASAEVAAALAGVLEGAAFVCCGDYSVDRGSGSVPAYLAAELGAAQGLGLVDLGLVDLKPGPSGPLLATRRLDHGRREVLAVERPAVLSFEGASAELRRAGLAAVLAARESVIDVRPGVPGRASRTRVTRRAPYRPRARVLPPPPAGLDVRGRILSLTGALVERTPPRTVHAEAAEAADLVLDQLRTWGYLE